MNRQSFFSPLAFGLSLALLTAAIPANADDLEQVIEKKLDSIIVSEINFVDVPIQQAMETLSRVSEVYDPATEGPHGVNISTRLPTGTRAVEPVVSLSARDLSLGRIIRLICESTGYRYDIRNGAVMISPDIAAFDLEFPGGTINDFVEAVEAAYGQDLNMFIDSKAGQLPFPPLSLRSVTLDGLYSIAAELTRDHSDLTWRRIQQGMWRISLPSQEESEPETLHTSVFHLGTLTDFFTFDDIATALQIVVEMEDAENVSVRIHEETGLLYFRGPSEANRSADLVFDNLLRQENILRQAGREPTRPTVEND